MVQEALQQLIEETEKLIKRKIQPMLLTEKEFNGIYMIQEKIQDYKQHRTISDSKLKGLFGVTILSDIDKINMKNSELT